jgi:hypothetical protein
MALIHYTDHSAYYAITYWSDGYRVAGFLGRPTTLGPHPAVIVNRGGYGETGALTGAEIVPYVEAGYVAAASQYRGNGGSEGGETFGSGDVNDVRNLITLLQAQPQVDPARIGMMGGSRGGMMTHRDQERNPGGRIALRRRQQWADQRPVCGIATTAGCATLTGVVAPARRRDAGKAGVVDEPRRCIGPNRSRHRCYCCGEADNSVSIQQTYARAALNGPDMLPRDHVSAAITRFPTITADYRTCLTGLTCILAATGGS